jgi:hypothetical protein
MDDTKKALLSIDIDTAALTQNVNNAKTAVADLKSQLDNLKAAGKDSGDAFDKLSEQLKKAGDEAKKSNDALKDHAKNMGDSTAAAGKLQNGIINLSKQNTDAATETTKYSKTLKEYADGLIKAAENANPVAKSIGDTAEKFKAFREITGQVSDAFKNYKDKISAAYEGSKTFNSAAGEGAKAFEVLKTGTQVAEGGVKSFSSALAATGIGLVILAVSALMDYLKQFTPLIDFTERATAGLSGGFNALGRIVLDLISPLKILFTNPKQAMVDLVNFLEQNVINRFKALGVIINGIIHLNFKQLADGVIQLGTGVTNATDKIANVTTKLGEYSQIIVKAATDTAKLKGEQQELNRSIQEEGLKSAETEAKIAELRVKAQTTDLAKRKEYLDQIKALEAGQAKTHEDNINKGVELAVKDVAIKRGLTAQEVALIKSKGVAEIELLERTGRIYADDVKALGEALTKKYGLVKEHYTKIDGLHQERTAKHKQRQKERSGIQLEEAKSTTNTAQNTVVAVTALDNTFVGKTIANAETVAKAKKKLNAATLTDYQQHFSKLSGLFAKNTQASKAAFAAQKAIAAAEIAINTEKQVSSIISATRTAVSDDMDLGPVAGPIKAAIDIAIGAVEVVGAIANGVKQATTINSTNPQGFARGGMYMSDGYGAYLTGPGTGTSDSINAKLSNGESIINARSTQMFAPILSAINMAGGGRAFNSLNGSNGYALGGLFNGSNTLNDGSNDLANTRAMNDMVKTIATNMPRQVLVVEDVQASLQNKVMLQNMSNF